MCSFSSSRCGMFRYVVVPPVVAALVFMPARNARADNAATMAAVVSVVVLGTLAVGVVGGDLAFTIHDAATAADSKPAATSWALGETLFTSPQSLYFNGVLAWAHGSGTVDEAPQLNLMILPAMWLAQAWITMMMMKI